MEQREQEKLISFWNEAFALSGEEREKEMRETQPDSWKQLAPSEKLFRAAEELGSCSHVLDFGCGTGWAGIIAAKSGCRDVKCVDAAENAAKAAGFYAELFGVGDRVTALCTGNEGAFSLPDGGFDGLICSNVLDVVPENVSAEMIRRFAQAVTKDARVVIGLNFCMPKERVPRPGERTEGNSLFVNDVLRLVSFTDEEWAERFRPYFQVESLEHFAWPGEQKETRRLFRLKKGSEGN